MGRINFTRLCGLNHIIEYNIYDKHNLRNPLQSFSIHAHFYQPPREDPFTGIIPIESGAAPFINWNERIHSECYRPNAELGNFERIGYNIGPTLFEWMAAYDPIASQRIVAQDRANIDRYGVGNAIAQPYHHTILPLATRYDKKTQIVWGIEQFKHRFGRKPQGMWLPETAVDEESLITLVDQGVEFTILAPWQAEDDNLDVTEPYRVRLPGGREITVFFYHGWLSGKVSFDPMATMNADQFVRLHLKPHFRPEKIQRGEPQLLMIASDGELYGHHQSLRDHFLAHLVNGAASQESLATTFPALWLREHPARQSVKIRERTSWSCIHGVARWVGSCSCVPGNQGWKSHLRHALDRFSQQLDVLYHTAVSPFVKDPWALRDDYIRVLLGLQPVEDLIAQASGKRLPEEICVRIQILLESQLERQKMYASCGWFFEDFERIEPRNSVAYAAKALHLTNRATGVDLAPELMANLEKVVSSRAGLRGDQLLNDYLSRSVRSK